MLKKIFFVFLFLLFVPVFAQAETIDIPYYQGWVTTDGGTTVNNGYWVQMNEFGHQNSSSGWTGYWNKDTNGSAHAIRLLNNGALAKIHWWYDGDGGTWVLSDAELFRVNANTCTYYGVYDFEDDEAYLADNPVRFPRKWRKGQTCSFEATINSGAITIQQSLTFLRKGLTVLAETLPEGPDLTDCALMQINVTSPDEVEVGVETWAPGKGEVWEYWHDSEDGEEVTSIVNDKVHDWGTGSYPQFMDFTTAMDTLNSLTLSDDNVKDFKLTGGTRVVVIPLGN